MKGYMRWSLKTVVKQTAGGGGILILRVIANELMFITEGSFGPDDYSGAETIRFDKIGVSGDFVDAIMFNASIDNIRFPITGDPDLSVNAQGDGTWKTQIITLSKDEYLKMTSSDLANTEEVTVYLSGWIKTQLPTLATTGSGGTPTITTAHNKVI